MMCGLLMITIMGCVHVDRWQYQYRHLVKLATIKAKSSGNPSLVPRLIRKSEKWASVRG